MSNDRETLKKEMEEYLDQFENLMDIPAATLTEEQREVLDEIIKERYAKAGIEFPKPIEYSIPPDIPIIFIPHNLIRTKK